MPCYFYLSFPLVVPVPYPFILIRSQNLSKMTKTFSISCCLVRQYPFVVKTDCLTKTIFFPLKKDAQRSVVYLYSSFSECSVGFNSKNGESCKPCPEKRYGHRCIQQCNCTDNQM